MKRINMLLLLSCISCMLFAQIGIMPRIVNTNDLTADAQRVLNNKLVQTLTANGFGATNSQFELVVNAVLVNKQVTASIPAQYILQYELTLSIEDTKEKKIYSSVSISTKGLDANESKAKVMAMNQINARSSALKNFMNLGRAKIVDYFNEKMPEMLLRVDALVVQEKYDEALAMLNTIPESVINYQLVTDKITEVIEKKKGISPTEFGTDTIQVQVEPATYQM